MLNRFQNKAHFTSLQSSHSEACSKGDCFCHEFSGRKREKKRTHEHTQHSIYSEQ